MCKSATIIRFIQKVIRSTFRWIETQSNYFFSYKFIKGVYLLLKTITPIRFRFSNKSWKNIVNKYDILGYKYHFMHFNLFKAYEYRIKQMIRYASDVDNKHYKSSREYLTIVLDREICSYFNIETQEYKWLENANTDEALNLSNRINLSEDGLDILMVGPSLSFKDVNYNDHDFIVINKPLVHCNSTIVPE